MTGAGSALSRACAVKRNSLHCKFVNGDEGLTE